MDRHVLQTCCSPITHLPACQAIRLVLIQIHRAEQRPKPMDGGLWVSVSSQTSPCSRTLSCTVGVAGLWGSVFSEELQDEVKQKLALFAFLSSPADKEELSTFTDNCGPLHFHLSFQVRAGGDTGKVNWSRTEQFLHRVSLVHAQVEIYFTVKINESIKQQVFRSWPDCRFTLIGCSLVTDNTSYLLCAPPVGPGPQCARLHPVQGSSTPLVPPPDVAEMCGVISLLPVGALSPCLDQHPNQPACVADIQILLYGPSNLPLLRGDGEGPLDFLCNLTHFLPWEDFGLSGVRFSENTLRGTLSSELVYTMDRTEQNDAVKQTLFLFLFLQHSDPFHSDLSDFTDSEEILVQNLDLILQHNSEIVKSAIYSILSSTLGVSLKRKQAQEKIQAALPVILTSLSTVVNSSSCLDFRNACLKKMKVLDTRELGDALQRSLLGVVEGRYVPSRKCNSSKQSMKNTSDTRDEVVSIRSKGKVKKNNQLEDICAAHSCPDKGRSAGKTVGKVGQKSCTGKRRRKGLASSLPAVHKLRRSGYQRTALCPPQPPLGQPAASEHMVQNILTASPPDQENNQEDDTWLSVFDWE
ncbi:type 2 DNA topoisomerase 6 subunit B-like isoform X2 [Scleropages formosus]|uniref:type 2 DNA topoisomerase 6 subunit B-like isoform X2 n=1 Tax=Scleropages formosus TaxID=113540 RepID=UPI000877F3DA|nr:type 2 DNA topoisomerase 6 subunit B-like isoform X2 [Scleropages formosus]